MSKTEPTPDEIRRDVARTRRELSDTAAALAHKADVPARVKEKAVAVKDVAAAKAEEVKHTAADMTEQAQETVRRTMDGLPQPVAQRVRDLVAAIRQRPVPFAVGAVVSIVVLRWVVRGRRS